MADATKYPISLYNKDGAVLQVNNPGEHDAAKKKGYGPKYVHTHFPKMLYNKTNGGSRTVNSEAELNDALAGDWTEAYVAPAAPKPAELPKEAAADDTSTVRALLAEIHDLKNRLEESEDRIEDLETAVAALGKAPKPAPAPKAAGKGKPGAAATTADDAPKA